MKVILILFSFAVAASAQNENLFRQCLPQVAAGGGWSTSISVYNLSDRASSGSLRFFDAQAQPLTFAVVRNGLSMLTDSVEISVGSNGATVIELPDFGSATQQGYAVLTRGIGSLNATVTFRQRIPGRPDFEATVPARNVVTKKWAMLFDNTTGLGTSFAIVNPDSDPAEFEFIFYDGVGSRLTSGVLKLAGGQQQTFSSASRWPALLERHGTVHVSRVDPGPAGADFGVNVLALRFNPTGAFSSIYMEPMSLNAIIRVIQ
jgi:hypothetical protein